MTKPVFVPCPNLIHDYQELLAQARMFMGLMREAKVHSDKRYNALAVQWCLRESRLWLRSAMANGSVIMHFHQ